MIGNKKVLALIPARGGSKGINVKNIIELEGRPLISYSILAARDSKYIDSTVVTTDSKEIADISKMYGAEIPFMRPKELAGDRSTTLEAVLHALRLLKQKYDILILLQPTSPLRTGQDIDAALETFIKNGCRALASVSEVHDSPVLMRRVKDNGEMEKLLTNNYNSTIRRQDMPAIYRINGSIYINSIESIDENTSFNDNLIAFVMTKEHSVDIDDYSDLAIAGYYLKEAVRRGDLC